MISAIHCTENAGFLWTNERNERCAKKNYKKTKKHNRERHNETQRSLNVAGRSILKMKKTEITVHEDDREKVRRMRGR